jgi:hypothetical protein
VLGRAGTWRLTLGDPATAAATLTDLLDD